MKIIISPAKSQNFDRNFFPKSSGKIPQFLEDTKILHQILQKKSPEDLQKLMKISENLAHLNFQKFQTWDDNFNIQKKSPPIASAMGGDLEGGIPPQLNHAISSFTGDVYQGFQLENYTPEDQNFMEKNLRIISGFYGLLTPLTLIKPYRLEMGTKLQSEIPPDKGARGFQNLYQFWTEKCTTFLQSELQPNEKIINLASEEYSKSLDRKTLKKHWLDIDFKVQKEGKLKTVGIFAKRQRGRLAHYIIKNKLENPEFIKNYQNDNFQFSPQNSTEKNYIFIKN